MDKRIVISFVPIVVVTLAFGVYLFVAIPSSPSTQLCLEQLPQGAHAFGILSNSSFGYYISFPNGTKTNLVPMDTCPVPVSHNLYSIVSAIETNQSFLKAENGAHYILDPTYIVSPTQTFPNNTLKSWTIFTFDDWSNLRAVATTCGTLYTNISQITVNVPYNLTTDTYVLSNISVSKAAQYSEAWTNPTVRCIPG